MKDFLDSGAKKLILVFEAENESVYAVGGCVRDTLMGRDLSDIDLAVSASPKRSERILQKNGICCVPTGVAHGTVTAVLGGKAYELTTFRTDGSYSDNRRPDSVSFVTDIETDLARRDFTMNAVAYNPETGIVDIFGGRKDIENKIIRTVGDPDLRFKEDALRILRALRFASVLGFEIEEKTAASIFKNAGLLKTIARERVTQELVKLLGGIDAGRVIGKYREIFYSVSPEFSMLKAGGVWDCALTTFERLPDDAQIRLCALVLFLSGCIDIEKRQFKSAVTAEMDSVNRLLGGLRLPGKTCTDIESILMNISTPEPEDKAGVKRVLSRIGIEIYSQVLSLRAAVFYALGIEKAEQSAKNTLNTVESIAKDHAVFSVSGLDISGNDLKFIGFEGAQIGEQLRLVLEKVIDGELENDRETIIEYLINSDCD